MKFNSKNSTSYIPAPNSYCFAFMILFNKCGNRIKCEMAGMNTVPKKSKTKTNSELLKLTRRISSSRNICSPVITSFSSRSFSSMLPFADAAAATSDAAILATLRSGILSDTMFSLNNKLKWKKQQQNEKNSHWLNAEQKCAITRLKMVIGQKYMRHFKCSSPHRSPLPPKKICYSTLKHNGSCDCFNAWNLRFSTEKSLKSNRIPSLKRLL